mgnify:CR=1 FL=1
MLTKPCSVGGPQVQVRLKLIGSGFLLCGMCVRACRLRA